MGLVLFSCLSFAFGEDGIADEFASPQLCNVTGDDNSCKANWGDTLPKIVDLLEMVYETKEISMTEGESVLIRVDNSICANCSWIVDLEATSEYLTTGT